MINSGPAPMVLLIHGAFTDTSLWCEVIAELQDAGVDAVAVGISLRSLSGDARYVESFARQLDRPVLLVGHAFGGAVIGNVPAENVVGLVFVSGLALEEGESTADILARFPETLLGPAFSPSSYPNGSEIEAVEMFLARSHYPRVFCADLPERAARTMASLQRPISVAALEEPARAPIWRKRPSWYVVAAADLLIHPDAQRFFAQRIGAETVEVTASHAAPVSEPGPIVRIILRALGRGG